MLALLYVAISFAAAWWITHPPRVGELDRTGWDQSQIEVGEVKLSTFRTGSGEAPLVVLAHGYRASAEQMIGLAAPLIEAGFAVFTFDFRGHGSSSPGITGAGALEGADLEAVLGRLRDERGSLDQVAVVGLSMGAAALALAPSADELGARVLLGCYDTLDRALRNRFHVFGGVDPGPLDWPLRQFCELLTGTRIADCRPVDAIARWPGSATLLIFGSDDERVGTDVPAAFRERLPTATVLEIEGNHRSLGTWQRQELTEPILQQLSALKSD